MSLENGGGVGLAGWKNESCIGISSASASGVEAASEVEGLATGGDSVGLLAIEPEDSQ